MNASVTDPVPMTSAPGPFGSRTVDGLRRLIVHLPRRRRRDLLLLVPLAAVAALVDLLLITAVARLTRTLSVGGEERILIETAMVVGLVWLVSLSRSLLRLRQYRLSSRIWADLSGAMLARVLDQPYAFHLGQHRSEILVTLHLHLLQLAQGIVTPTVQAIGNLVTILLLGIGLTWLSGPSALLLMAALLVSYTAIATTIKPILRRVTARRLREEMAAQGLVHDGLANIRTLLLRHGQDDLRDRFTSLSDGIAEDSVRADWLPELPRLLIEPIGLSLVLATVLLPSLSLGTSPGIDSLPSLALISLALVRLAQPLQELFRALNRLQGHLPLMEEALALLELPVAPAPPRTIPSPATPSPAPPRDQLGLAGVWFRYHEREPWVLQGLDLILPVGARVALVGPSGSGKSTIASLLLGLHSPQAGGLELDGMLLSPRELSRWQSHCSEVAQPVRLLNGSVIDNILFRPGGGEDHSEDPAVEAEVWEALEAARLAEDVRRLPEGIHTRIGEDGQRLSGGQRQRLALARALCRRPAFLVLDEATSAIDQRTESAILRTLALLDHHTTVLLIAHRPSLMRHCDRIHELRDGRIVASGSYGELLERSPTFPEMINRRLPAAEGAGVATLPAEGIR